MKNQMLATQAARVLGWALTHWQSLEALFACGVIQKGGLPLEEQVRDLY